MNLYAEDEKGHEVELWQTPTWITRLCLYRHNGKKRKWKDTLHLYSQWVDQHTQGVWHSEEEYKDMKTRVDEHLYELMLNKKLKFFEM
jgi:hypothetical protein